MSQQKQSYTPGQYKNSQEAKQLQKFIEEQYNDAEKNAREMIFTALPELHFKLSEELEKEKLLQFEAVNDTYKELVQRYVDLNSAAVPNSNVIRLHGLIERYQQEFSNVSNQILFWVQILLPKVQSSGSNSSQEFLVVVAAMIQKIQELSEGYEEQFLNYYKKRADIIKQILKRPVDDYFKSLVYTDIKQILLTREVLSNLNTNILNLYKIIDNGFEKIRDQRKHKSTDNAYY